MSKYRNRLQDAEEESTVEESKAEEHLHPPNSHATNGVISNKSKHASKEKLNNG